MHLSDFPDDVIVQYGLKNIANKDGMVFVKIPKGMYGLPQVDLLAHELLKKCLNKHENFQSTHTPVLWTHKWHSIPFTLVVDDFSIKYVGKDNLQHLTSILQESNKIFIVTEGSQYIEIHFDWDYENREVHLSTPGYVKKAVK